MGKSHKKYGKGKKSGEIDGKRWRNVKQGEIDRKRWEKGK